MEPEDVTFKLLREITDDFSHKLGEGSFGVVYRGVTYTGEDVAVKMLKYNDDINTDAGSNQFKNEIYNLAMLKHQNIVQIFGYCYEIEKKTMVCKGEKLLFEDRKRAICLEYLHNGSLQQRLSDESGGLDWETRFKIIKGTCEGLKYIIDELEQPLYHLDLKPQNILLDKDMVPKIADFGLSRIFGKDLITRTTQSPLGTLGYQPPEYIERQEVSEKFDIFSLGVVMIRIVSGPEGYNSECQKRNEFIDQVQRNWRNRLKATCSSDSALEAYCYQVKICTQIALDCVERDILKRPDVGKITEKLNEIDRGKVWVDVSQRFDLNKICESIILQLAGKNSLEIESQMIHSFLNKLLPGKKILIVLDDLWEDNQFQQEELKKRLHHKDSIIIVLVTTRDERVADRICTNIQPYNILPLTDDICWDIIKQRSGFETRNDKEQLTDIGRDIAQKCGGVALAARSLGFTLRSMSYDQWLKVKQTTDIWNKYDSRHVPLANHVLATLMVSYRYMASCLRQCFSYCAIFPKGYKICKNDLIYQWISLDIIKPTKLLSSMHLCEKYILQLHGLSFFQHSVPPKTSYAYNEQDTFFTMHDLVHDLAISLLRNQILDQSKQGNPSGNRCQYALLSDCSKPLKLCLTSRAKLIALRFLDGCRSKLIGAAFSPARSLRVLDLSECSINKLSHSIGQLKQLRYLKAPRIKDETVPESITKLSNLIYLNLLGSSIVTLPDSIGELKSLMHLVLSHSYVEQLPDSFRDLENLVHLELSNTIIYSGISESLRSLTRLEHLNLDGCGNIRGVTRQLSSLTKLQYLNLSRNATHAQISGLPQVLVNLTKLRYLALGNCFTEEETDIVFDHICKLSNLEHLDLSRNYNLCMIPEIDFRNLSKLHTLNFSDCIKLERLPASISEIDSLKYLHIQGCRSLDKSTLPQYRNCSNLLLPHFVVHAADGESTSNLCQLENENPTALEIIRLENVKSEEEAQRIKLVEKQNIQMLQLVWTAMGSVDHEEVLKQLIPPNTVETLVLQGYNSRSFPRWMMSISTFLPRLVEITLQDLLGCSSLPPLGQLPNLKILYIRRLNNIRKIGKYFYGGTSAFPELSYFSLGQMQCLDEWDMPYSRREDGSNLLMFPKLETSFIKECPELKFKSNWPLGNNDRLFIYGSDKVMLSSLGDRGHVGAWSYATTTYLEVECCEAPLHQWNLLRHLPCLKYLSIKDCSDLTCSSEDILQGLSSLETLSVDKCKRIVVALPERLGDLTSLRKLAVSNCKGIETLPESIQLLTGLQDLSIHYCPELIQWCKLEGNKMKLAHIINIHLLGEPTRRMMWRRQQIVIGNQVWSVPLRVYTLPSQQYVSNQLLSVPEGEAGSSAEVDDGAAILTNKRPRCDSEVHERGYEDDGPSGKRVRVQKPNARHASNHGSTCK